MIKVSDIVGNSTEEEKHVREIFKNAKIHINKEDNTGILICIPAAAYIYKNNIANAKSIILKSLKERFGIDDVRVGPITYIPEENPQVLTGKLAIPFEFNPKYTFDNFVVSKCNESAFRASMEIVGCIANEGKISISNNQLFIRAEFGLGKTHLAQAIAQEVVKLGKSVAYFHANSFTRYIVSSTTGSPQKRIEKLKKVKDSDLLIIDDVYLLAGKKRTQAELKALIDFFFDRQKALVFTSIYPQNNMPNGFMEEVASRMQDGLTVVITTPDLELKEELLKFGLPEPLLKQRKIVESLASIEVKSVREFNSVISIVNGLYEEKNGEISFSDIKKRLETQNIRIPAIEEERVAQLAREIYGDEIRFKDLQGRIKGANRQEKIILRKAIITRLVKEKGYSQAEVARIFHISKAMVTYILQEGKNKQK